jgi:hypothetical protein
LIDKEVLDSVIRPFAIARQTKFSRLPEYSHLIEEPKEIFISSAYHRGLWWEEETKKTILAMLRGDNSGFIAFDLRISIFHKIKTVRQLKNEISKMDELTAMEEYYNIRTGENSQSYFKMNQFLRARKISQAFYPQKEDNYNSKKNPYGITDTVGEIRILACDLAQRSGRKNDLSITSCLRLLPTHKGYLRELVFQEAYSGVNSITQALRIKQIFHDFNADAMIMDVGSGGGGVPILDSLGQLTKDESRGIEYPPFTVMPHASIDQSVYDELSKRTLGINALPVIYPFSPSAKLNSTMAVEMKDKLQKRLINLLVDEARAEDYLIKTRTAEFMKSDDPSAKAFFMQPFINTSLMISEAVNLSMSLTAGNIKLSESNTGRKDRVSSLMMGNYYASLLDAELLKDNSGVSNEDAILGITFIL